ncbi:MAG: ribosome silencing factor [Clostridia bacterium]
MNTVQEKVDALVKMLEENKAENVIAINVGDKTIIADYFIICSGRSVPHVKALSEYVDEKAPELGLEILRTEGYSAGRWIVMDMAYVLVHIFLPEEREYYNMERLYRD